MGGIANSPAPEQLSPGKWIIKVILAVILGEAIWGLLVSLTNGLIVPELARVIVGDPQSPVYLGKGDFNLTAIFISILELCLAGIVAILLNQWSSASSPVRVKTVKVKAAKAAMPSIAPSAMTSPPESVPSSPSPEPAAAVVTPITARPAPSPTPSVPVAAPQASAKPAAPVAKAPAKPDKPRKPHEVYYNLVGEPINPTEGDE